MYHAHGKFLTHKLGERTVQRKAHAVLRIEDVVHVLAVHAPQTSHDGRRWTVGAPHGAYEPEVPSCRRQLWAPDVAQTPVMVHEPTGADHPTCVGALERVDRGRERARQVVVVAVDVRDDVPGGASQALVECMGLPPVPF
jgi:hypothetical protein